MKTIPPYAIPLVGAYPPPEPFLLTVKTLRGVGIPPGRSLPDAQIHRNPRLVALINGDVEQSRLLLGCRTGGTPVTLLLYEVARERPRVWYGAPGAHNLRLYVCAL